MKNYWPVYLLFAVAIALVLSSWSKSPAATVSMVDPSQASEQKPWEQYSDGTASVSPSPQPNAFDQFDSTAATSTLKPYNGGYEPIAVAPRSDAWESERAAREQRNDEFTASIEQRRQERYAELEAERARPAWRDETHGVRTLRDQKGHEYQQPEGSTFATDPQTGQQCFVNGAFIHC